MRYLYKRGNRVLNLQFPASYTPSSHPFYSGSPCLCTISIHCFNSRLSYPSKFPAPSSTLYITVCVVSDRRDRPVPSLEYNSHIAAQLVCDTFKPLAQDRFWNLKYSSIIICTKIFSGLPYCNVCIYTCTSYLSD